MSRLLDIREQIQDTQAAMSQLDRVIAAEPPERRNSPSLVISAASLRKRYNELEAEFVREANRVSIDVCSYRIFADNLQPTVTTVAGAMGKFQKLVSVVYAALKHGRRERQSLSEDVVQETSFEFGYSFAGSVGLVFTLPNQRMLGEIESRLDEAFRDIIEMTRATTPAELLQFSHRLGIAPMRALYAWADEHVSGAVGVGLDWRRNQDIRMSRIAQLRELESLRNALESTSEEKTTRQWYRGLLMGVDVDPKRFHFRPDGRDDIRGTYETAITPALHPEIYKRYTADIEKVEVVNFATEKEDVRYFLHSLTDMGQRPYDEP